MNFKILGILSILLLALSSCEGNQKKEAVINKSVQAIQKEMNQQNSDSLKNDLSTSSIEKFGQQLKSKITGASPGDSIIGIWEVRNDYYMAVYEIVKYKNEYWGKVHYYNDGTTEFKGKNNEEDYFLEGITYLDGLYSQGQMHLQDGSNYTVQLKLSDDQLKVSMNIEGQPYSEIWKKKR